MRPAVTGTSAFADANQISSWALETMRWANAGGIINGYGNGTLNPRGNATRAQAAQIFKNFWGNP